MAVARVARRHNTIEHVDTGGRVRPGGPAVAPTPIRVAGAARPAWTGRPGLPTSCITCGRLAHRKSPESKTIEGERRDFLEVGHPHLKAGAALDNAEAQLPRTARRGQAALRPPGGALHSLANSLGRGIGRGALVKRHGDSLARADWMAMADSGVRR